MSDITGAIVKLEHWVEHLELAYIETAVQASERDVLADPEAAERDGALLDRLQSNLDRAKTAMELWRKHTN